MCRHVGEMVGDLDGSSGEARSRSSIGGVVESSDEDCSISSGGSHSRSSGRACSRDSDGDLVETHSNQHRVSHPKEEACIAPDQIDVIIDPADANSIIW
ncbi:unnamed protein product [Linum trigynum]|uniref:Uncharacterized protein n=1 Tax=Linum trigynum TaxID=586398 RepID=A0AAV2F800_9ROSI